MLFFKKNKLNNVIKFFLILQKHKKNNKIVSCNKHNILSKGWKIKIVFSNQSNYSIRYFSVLEDFQYTDSAELNSFILNQNIIEILKPNTVNKTIYSSCPIDNFEDLYFKEFV